MNSLKHQNLYIFRSEWQINKWNDHRGKSRKRQETVIQNDRNKGAVQMKYQYRHIVALCQRHTLGMSQTVHCNYYYHYYIHYFITFFIYVVIWRHKIILINFSVFLYQNMRRLILPVAPVKKKVLLGHIAFEMKPSILWLINPSFRQRVNHRSDRYNSENSDHILFMIRIFKSSLKRWKKRHLKTFFALAVIFQNLKHIPEI